MKMRVANLSAIVFLSFFAMQIRGQECGNCKITPLVANYDLDVQIPKLADTGQAMLQWRLLFWLGRHANAYLFQKNKDCIRFTQPAELDENGNEFLNIGETHTSLPGKGAVNEYGDYLVTGFVSNANGGGLLHLELQTACTRKTVASAEVPFNYSTESSYLMGIAHQAASQLTPLIDKIKEFELKERNENRQIALSGFFSEEIKIKPDKSSLKPGEETSFDVEVKDCDGTPLKQAEVEFSKATIEGFSIDGTTGGIVTPVKLITDASGKAKGKFRMNTGNSSAILNAHCIVKKPNGCADAFVGSVEIGSVPHLKINFDYQLYETTKIGLTSETKIDKISVGGDASSFMRSHRTTLYYYPAKPTANVNANLFPKPVPGFSDGSKFVFVLDKGFFTFNNKVKGDNGRETLANSGFAQNDTTAFNAGNASPSSRPEIHFNIINNELKNFSIEFNYPGEIENENAHPGYPGNFLIEGDDPGVKVTTRLISDPTSRYKREYKITLADKANKVVGDVYKQNRIEEFVLIILSSY